ncbi:LysR family transcriptional regulator [Sphingobium sp. H39-3-25]|uniref:LysR family transcriptional regulator n=1 Tax=Sphingobium arseniciresistens TaxID=3030834 RepID=UPI0023B93C8D|nr:LysR family transcriptional regulator [Sphingobium arseniciresistens]
MTDQCAGGANKEIVSPPQESRCQAGHGLFPGLTTRTFDLVTLKLFSTVVTEGNMARAAESENITPSAISRRIAALEARLGVRLLDRTDRGVRPTPEGLELLGCAQDVLSTIEKTTRKFDALKNGAAGIVHIHAHMSSITPHLARAIREFRERAPDIVLLIEERTSTEVVDDIHGGRADLGFVSGTIDMAGLSSRPWISDELVAVVHPSHPLASIERLALRDALDFPFIAMQRNSALCSLFEKAAREEQRQFLPCAYMASFESVLLLVEAGLGISILPEAFAAGARRNVAIVRLQEPWAKRNTALCHREPALLSAAARRALDFFAEASTAVMA